MLWYFIFLQRFPLFPAKQLPLWMYFNLLEFEKTMKVALENARELLILGIDDKKRKN